MRVLIVPEAAENLRAVRLSTERCAREGRIVFERAATFAQARRSLLNEEYVAALCDLGDSPEAGLDLLREVRGRGLPVSFVLLVGEPGPPVDRRASQLGQALCLRREALSEADVTRALTSALACGVPQPPSGPPRRTADLAPAMLWRTNAEGAFTHFTQEWCRFTGRPEERETGSGWTAGLHIDEIGRWTETYQSALEHRRSFELDLRLRRAEGSHGWIRHRGVPRFGPDGDFWGYVGSSFDITDLKLENERLLRLGERFARDEREIEEFAATTAHDLREPLAGLAHQLEGMTQPGAGHTAEELRAALETVGRLQSLLDDLLTWARAGSSGGPIEPTDPAGPLEWALSNLRGLTEKSGARIASEPMPMVWSEPAQLARVFQNLIGNAIKFRGRDVASVRVGAEVVGSDVLFHVADNGVGIDPVDHGLIFEPFGRARNASSSGTGLGLSICKKIIERQGGRLWVESEAGKGATFRFALQEASRASPSP